MTECREQQSRHSTSSHMVRFCSLHAVTSSVIYYSTHMRKIFYLFVTFTISCQYKPTLVDYITKQILPYKLAELLVVYIGDKPLV